MDKQSFGKYIAEKRKQLGMTQMQLAEKLHGDGQGCQQVGTRA